MWIIRGMLSLCVLIWLGCPVAPPEQPPQAPGGPGGGGAAGEGMQNPPPGDTGAPPEGGGAPPEGGGAPPEGGAPGAPNEEGEAPAEAGKGVEASEFDIEEGQGILVSGTVTYSGSQDGDIRVDLLKENYQGSAMPKVMTTVAVASDGTFQIEVPKGFGKVNVVAFLDFDGNGISPGEPIAAKNGVNIKNAAISGLKLKLGDDPSDIEVRLPPIEGAAPPDGAAPEGEPPAAPPKDGEPPPEGAPPAGGGPPTEAAG